MKEELRSADCGVRRRERKATAEGAEERRGRGEEGWDNHKGTKAQRREMSDYDYEHEHEHETRG
jgi:hypothetical protein